MPTPANVATVKVTPCLSPAALKFVELQLANYLGAGARTLVSHAAEQAPGSHTLILQLASAVGNASERDGFLQSCTHYLD